MNPNLVLIYIVKQNLKVKILNLFRLNINDDKIVDGRIIIRDNFKSLMKKNNKIILFGEDVGKIGDVNKGAEGLQMDFGENRVFDTGIRETTIIGKGIGLALRGFRPIAEIQYIDYVFIVFKLLVMIYLLTNIEPLEDNRYH